MADRITLIEDNEFATTAAFNQRLSQINAALNEIDDPEQGAIPEIQQNITELQNSVAAKSSKSITAAVTLTAAGWVEDAANGWWTQAVSNPAIVDGRQVEIFASPAVVNQLAEDGATLVLENNAGTAAIYALGAVPTIDLTMELVISEVTEQ